MKHEDQQAISELYRLTRSEQPSAELDQRIRHAAHHAIGAKKPNWIWSLSTAAVILLSVNVVLNVYDPDEDETAILFEESRHKPAEQIRGQSYDIAPAESLSNSSLVDAMKPMVTREPARILVPKTAMPELELDAISSQNLEERARVPRKDVDISLQSIKSEILEKEKRSSRLISDDIEQQQSKKSRSETRQYSAPQSLGLGRAQVESKAFEKSAGLSFVTPSLPTSTEELRSLDPSLTAEQGEANLVSIFRESHLILTVQEQTESYIFTAYRGSEILGVQIDWTLPPVSIGEQCLLQNSIMKCALNETSDAYFEGENLIYIRWDQSRNSD